MLENKQEAKKVLWITLVLNFLVAAAKSAYGVVSGSASMTADGLHSFSDGTSNIIGLIGLSIAGKPTDEDHPYGHQKFETLTSLLIGVLLFLVSFNIVKTAVLRFLHPATPEVTAASFIIMFSTMAVNIFVMLYENREGKRLKSDFLVSDSYHTRSDILVSVSVICALVAVKAGLPVLDPVVSIFIAIMIAFTAVEIILSGSKVLADAAIIDPKLIENIVMGFDDVKLCHKIRTRGREDSIFIDLHVWVNPDLHISRCHKLAHDIEARIKEKIPGVQEVIVHIEPSG